MKKFGEVSQKKDIVYTQIHCNSEASNFMQSCVPINLPFHRDLQRRLSFGLCGYPLPQRNLEKCYQRHEIECNYGQCKFCVIHSNVICTRHCQGTSQIIQTNAGVERQSLHTKTLQSVSRPKSVENFV